MTVSEFSVDIEEKGEHKPIRSAWLCRVIEEAMCKEAGTKRLPKHVSIGVSRDYVDYEKDRDNDRAKCKGVE